MEQKTDKQGKKAINIVAPLSQYPGTIIMGDTMFVPMPQIQNCPDNYYPS